MEKIDGIDLSNVLDQATSFQFEERKKEVMIKVLQVLNGVEQARKQLFIAEKNFKKSQEVYQKGIDKLESLKKGDWNQLSNSEVKPELKHDKEVGCS